VTNSQSEFDNPYPLKRLIRRRVFPLYLILGVAFGGAVAVGGTELMESIYLEFASRRAAIIDEAMMQTAPVPWTALSEGALPEGVYETPSGAQFLKSLRTEESELSLSRLQIYGPDGTIVYSTIDSRIGHLDASPAFLAAMVKNERTIVRKPADDGTELYELYVPLQLDSGGRLVVELYEPVGILDKVLLKAVGPAVAAPLIFLVLLGLASNGIISRAQRDIDWRTSQLARLRQELEKFVSRSTIDATRQSVGQTAIGSRQIECTLLMSDIRNFTAYSEERTPEEVVKFLNRVMSIQVAAITQFGGDVDKMIGDAVLAIFDGENREERAIKAAEKLLRDLDREHLPRGVGVGVFSGPVISGAIGPTDRQDFTVIGDSVNVTARLCSAANAGELIVDAQTMRSAGVEITASEELSLKGRKQVILIERRKIS